MKILSVQERTVPLTSDTSNAAISFSTMTASAVVIEVETVSGRFKGLGFSSYGRYGQGGLLNERFIPRLLNAHARDFEGKAKEGFSMASFWDILMQDDHRYHTFDLVQGFQAYYPLTHLVLLVHPHHMFQEPLLQQQNIYEFH